MDILYECDRRACERCRYPFCRYTKDINHAVNFRRTFFGNFVETIKAPEQPYAAQDDEEEEESYDNHN